MFFIKTSVLLVRKNCIFKMCSTGHWTWFLFVAVTENVLVFHRLWKLFLLSSYVPAGLPYLSCRYPWPDGDLVCADQLVNRSPCLGPTDQWGVFCLSHLGESPLGFDWQLEFDWQLAVSWWWLKSDKWCAVVLPPPLHCLLASTGPTAQWRTHPDPCGSSQPGETRSGFCCESAVNLTWIYWAWCADLIYFM